MNDISALGNNKGFTLIELIIVIVLIGILAATALPKFANLSQQARTASNQGVAGGLGAAVSIAHAAWIAAGASSAATSNVTLDGTSVGVNASGWPSNGKALGAMVVGDCTAIWTGILNNPPTATTGACAVGSTNCYVATLPSADTCLFTLSGVTPVTTIQYVATNGAVTFNP